MAPLRVFTGWDTRPSDKIVEQIEPHKRYFLICEGENTEKWYFEQLISDKKALKIRQNIAVKYVERTGEDLHNSNPVKLLEQADQIVNDETSGYEDGDVIVLIFDVDIYVPDREKELAHVMSEAMNRGYWLGVTNPSIELFLLLHIPDSYNNHILPNKIEILKNRTKKGVKPYIQKLFKKCTGKDSKKDKDIGLLSADIDIAIEQEKNLNQEISRCTKEITCNIGTIISKIRDEE